MASPSGSKSPSTASSPRSANQMTDQPDIESPTQSIEQLAEARKAAGTARYSAGAFEEAVQLYSEAIDLLDQSKTPISPSVKASYLNNRAAARLMLKQYDQSLVDALAAIEVDPSFGKAYQRAAKCYMLLGKFSQSKSIISRAPAGLSLKNELADVNKYEMMQKRADALIEANQHAYAINVLKQLTEGCPAHMDAQLQLVNAMMASKQLDEAKTLVDSLYRSQPSNLNILLTRGRWFYANGNLDMALKHCQECLRADPDHSQAAKLFKTIRAMNVRKEEGNTLFSSGQSQQAVDKYTECLAFDPSNNTYNATILANRAAAYMKLKQWEQAITDCDSSLALNDSNVKVLLRRSQCRKELLQWEECVRDLEAAAKIAPSQDLDRQVREAKLELKKSKRKDYYAILGLTKENFSESELKRAYRKAAMTWHPDKNNSSEEQRVLAEAKFKDITEANEVLSDTNKRRRYDSGVDLEEDGPGGGAGGFGGMDPSDLFGMFFSQGGGGGGFGGSPFGGMGGGGRGHGHSHGPGSRHRH